MKTEIIILTEKTKYDSKIENIKMAIIKYGNRYVKNNMEK